MPDEAESTIEEDVAGPESEGFYDGSETSQIDQLADDFEYQVGSDTQANLEIPEAGNKESEPNRGGSEEGRAKENEQAFTFNSLEEVSQALNNEGWTKTYASQGGDALQREEQGRAWMFKDEDGKKSPISPDAGTEEAVRHEVILEGLYTQGFAIMEFDHLDGKTSVRQVFFADEKGNISYEIYNSAKEPAIEEAGIKVEDFYDDQQDPLPDRILRKEGETTEQTASPGIFKLKEAKAEAAAENPVFAFKPETAPQPIDIDDGHNEAAKPAEANLPIIKAGEETSADRPQGLSIGQPDLRSSDAFANRAEPDPASKTGSSELPGLPEGISIEEGSADESEFLGISAKDIEANTKATAIPAEGISKLAEAGKHKEATQIEVRDGKSFDDLGLKKAAPLTVTARSVALKPRENAQTASLLIETGGIALLDNNIPGTVEVNTIRSSAEVGITTASADRTEKPVAPLKIQKHDAEAAKAVDNAYIKQTERPIGIVLDINEGAELPAEGTGHKAKEVVETGANPQEKTDAVTFIETKDRSTETISGQDFSSVEGTSGANKAAVAATHNETIGIEAVSEDATVLEAETMIDTAVTSETNEQDDQAEFIIETGAEATGIALAEEEDIARDEKNINAAIKAAQAGAVRPEPAVKQIKNDEIKRVDVEATAKAQSKESAIRRVDFKAIDIEEELVRQPATERAATVRQAEVTRSDVPQKIRETGAQRNGSRTVPITSSIANLGQRQPIPQRAVRQKDIQADPVISNQRPIPASRSNQFVNRMLNYRPTTVTDDEEITVDNLETYVPELELAA